MLPASKTFADLRMLEGGTRIQSHQVIRTSHHVNGIMYVIMLWKNPSETLYLWSRTNSYLNFKPQPMFYQLAGNKLRYMETNTSIKIVLTLSAC